MAGLFLALEGPEGAGKSTQLQRLAERLQGNGHSPLLTREPGGTPLGDAVRSVVLDPALEVSPLPEFLLYSASRAQLVERVIAPALAAGRVVVSDRFTAASIAYQGYGRGLDLGFVRQLNERATGGLRPHLTILLDIDPRLGLERIADRGERDRLELADLEFHYRVRRGFLAQAEAEEGWLVVDASADPGAIAEELWAAVTPRLAALPPVA